MLADAEGFFSFVQQPFLHLLFVQSRDGESGFLGIFAQLAVVLR